jgi:hypothetical protein
MFLHFISCMYIDKKNSPNGTNKKKCKKHKKIHMEFLYDHTIRITSMKKNRKKECKLVPNLDRYHYYIEGVTGFHRITLSDR